MTPPGPLAEAGPALRVSRWSPCCPSRSGSTPRTSSTARGPARARTGWSSGASTASCEVRDDGEPGTETASRTLVHGGIIHGTQWRPTPRGDGSRRRTTARRPASGRAIALLPTDRGRRVGVVGLGAGTLAAYGRPGDVYRVYEINPLVIRLAETEFTYLRESPAEVAVLIGDARRRLEGEPPQAFDLLAVDAFSGDSIPAHLLTQEALALYMRHLAPGRHPRRPRLEPVRRLRPGPGGRRPRARAPGDQRARRRFRGPGSATTRSGSSFPPSEAQARYPALSAARRSARAHAGIPPMDRRPLELLPGAARQGPPLRAPGGLAAAFRVSSVAARGVSSARESAGIALQRPRVRIPYPPPLLDPVVTDMRASRLRGGCGSVARSGLPRASRRPPRKRSSAPDAARWRSGKKWP